MPGQGVSFVVGNVTAAKGTGNHEEREDHEGKAEKAAIASVRLEVSVNICVHLRMVLG